MRLWLFILLSSIIGCLAQDGGQANAAGSWEPRNLVTKAGLVAYYDPGNTSTMTFNPAGYAAGSGVSWLSNRVSGVQSDLQQGTAANQPIISRTDSAGNLLKQSQTFSTSWSMTRLNAFAASDLTNTLNSGSFENTTRVLDPLGGNTADFIQEDTTAANTHYIKQAYTGPAGTYTFSVWVRESVRRWVRLRTEDFATGLKYGNGFFDVLNGVTASSVAGGGVSVGTLSISGPVNGFYLCTMPFTIATSERYDMIITIGEADADVSFNGNGTDGLFLWGASLVPATWTPVTGATAALGYIATTTVPILPGLNGRSVMYFDGAAYRMQTAAFTLHQPTELYSLAMPWSWTLNDVTSDGFTNNTGRIYQADTSPKIRMSAGTASAEFTPPPAGTWRVVNAVFDGASSRMSTNAGAFTVSDAGTGNMGGLTLGSASTAGTTYWNGLLGRQLLCNKTNETAEANYLRWGLLKEAGL